MENNARAKEIIVTLLQNSLAGQLDASSHFNPQFVADAIADKIVFDKSYSDIKNDKVVGKLVEEIVTRENEMEKEYEELDPDYKLLRNFIRGKITAYNDILDIINKL